METLPSFTPSRPTLLIAEQHGRHFDPHVVGDFQTLFARFVDIANRNPDVSPHPRAQVANT